jgi:hypothetical protein
MTHFILRLLTLFLIAAFLFALGVTLERMPSLQADPWTLWMFGAVFSLGFSLLYMMITRGR